MTEKQEEKQTYSFYSRVLQKPFDTIEELTEAEAEYTKKVEAKKQAAEVKKTDANKVELAYKNISAVKTEYNKQAAEARKAYLEEVKAARSKYDTAISALDKTVQDAEEAYNKELKEFNVKYPEGFHITLKSDDSVTSITKNVNKGDANIDLFDSLENFYNSVFDFFNLY